MPRKNKQAYNKYMKNYMKKYRLDERELLRKAKEVLGWPRKKGGKK
ncbi:MAG: hypothetical protein ACXACY_26495 [Candidatus Hodarchaeales archaeon]